MQQQICGLWGFMTQGSTITGIETLNAAANRMAFAFVPQANTSLSACRFYNGTKSGTGGTITCQLFGDSGGIPNITGGALDTLTVGTISGNSFVNCTGGTTALTAGTQYWVVIANTDASPATNSIQIWYGNTGTTPTWYGCDTATSSNSGTSWLSNRYGAGMRFDFADGTYWGTPLNGNFSGTGITGGIGAVNSTNEMGVQFTTPANVKLNTAGAAMYWQPIGTPTGGVLFKLYDASHALLAQTYSLSNAESKAVSAVVKSRLWVPSTDSVGANGIYTLQPSTTYTITMAETTNSDTSSNIYRPYGYAWDTDANSTPLIPWSMQLDYFNGTTWTQFANKFLPFALLLATGDEFTSTGGGGGTTGYAFCA